MLINASQRFARRTAVWMLKSGMSSKTLEGRLKVFSEDHVRMIGDQVRDIRGQLPK